MAGKIEGEFVKKFGRVGDVLHEDKWLYALGLFAAGWEAANRFRPQIKETKLTSDNKAMFQLLCDIKSYFECEVESRSKGLIFIQAIDAVLAQHQHS